MKDRRLRFRPQLGPGDHGSGQESFDPSIEAAKVTIRFGATAVFKKGSPVDCDLEALRKYLSQSEVAIGVELGIGKASARVWGCDLTEGYVKENAYYTT